MFVCVHTHLCMDYVNVRASVFLCWAASLDGSLNCVDCNTIWNSFSGEVMGHCWSLPGLLCDNAYECIVKGPEHLV